MELWLPIPLTEFSVRHTEPDRLVRLPPILLFGELEPKLRSQYTAQYNFGIQHQLTKDMVLSVGYVGSQGHRCSPPAILILETRKPASTCRTFRIYYTMWRQNRPWLRLCVRPVPCGQFLLPACGFDTCGVHSTLAVRLGSDRRSW